MDLIDCISRQPVVKLQPPAYCDKHFVVALVDDFVNCLEFQDSSIANISLNKNPIRSLGAKKLNRNETLASSFSIQTQTAFTVQSQLFQNSRFADTQTIHNSSDSLKTIQSRAKNEQTNETRHGLTII